jgi:diguanylate cyclase (GGDEF)-like protein
MEIKKNTIFICTLWMLFIATSFGWNYIQMKKEQEELALHAARTLFELIINTCRWNILHGSVYVPVTHTTLPSPWLKEPLRDIKVNDSLTLTKINHACMTRQISEVAMKQNGIEFHFTSLHPIRPENKATEHEKAFLQESGTAIREVGLFINNKNKRSFLYMTRLNAKKPCLPCHDNHDYKEGDVIGGISITIPITQKNSYGPLLLAHIGIALTGLLGILVSGVRLNRAYATIQRQAVFDSLTGIPNRQSFSEHIVTEFSRSNRTNEPLAVIMCDIDHFKAYNDTYGHASGDECLKKVAQTIDQTLERPGDFCARYGGEEFVVILTDTSHNGAMHIAEKIRSNILDLQIVHKKAFPLQFITLSLGVATSIDQPLTSHEELLKNADTALYLAKANGRNRVESFTDMPQALESEQDSDGLFCSDSGA